MKKLSLLLVLIFFMSNVQAQTGCLCADIIILSDFSSSINNNEHVVTYSVKSLVEGIPPQDNLVRFALVSFGEQTRTEVGLTSDYSALLAGVHVYEERIADGAFTKIDPAFDMARNIFLKNRRNEQCFRIIIVISDGQFTDRGDALIKANVLRSDTDYPIAIFSLSAFNGGMSIRIGDARYLQVVPGNTPTLDIESLKSVSGGAYFGNDVHTLRQWIIEMGMCL